jgi:hypothetical protein
MSLVEYCDREALPHWPIYSHLHRHGFCASTCTGLADIASPDHAACIARLRSLNPWHLGKIIAKGRTLNPKPNQPHVHQSNPQSIRQP